MSISDVRTPEQSRVQWRTVHRIGDVDTESTLAHALSQAQARHYDRFTIVDCDIHHYENESWTEIADYIDDPIIRMRAGIAGTRKAGPRSPLFPSIVGDQDGGGRILRYPARHLEQGEADTARDVVLLRRAMRMIGIDYVVAFPTPMLVLGLHPELDVEIAVARAYARWMTERILPEDASIKTLLYLPFNDPDASLKVIKEFGDKPGVLGFLVTSVRYRPVHHNVYMKVYAELEERGLPLGFHAGYDWNDRALHQLNRFVSAHALGMPFHNMIHLTNMVINGIPKRFPNLKVIWIESGLAWIPFLMQRLDNGYFMRTNDAPLLDSKPSDYMRRFYYTSQPMERGDRNDVLEMTFDLIDAEHQLLYSSDYPHWDFDLPSQIYDLPFLGEDAKRRILGLNAMDLFGLEPVENKVLGTVADSSQVAPS